MKHLIFLINPKSGVDRKKQFTAIIDQTLDKTLFSYEIQHTEYEKHGTELAKKAAEENNVYGIIVVGGDGSVNDVIKGLKDATVILGIIPKGSGNGMARTMGIPLSVKKSIEIINKDKVEDIDVAYANEHAFLSNAGVGFDARVIEKFRHNKKRGFLSYCTIINNSIWGYRSKEYQIQIDGQQWEEQAFIINMANGKELGYGFEIAPNADWKDGMLEVTIIRKFPKLNALMLALRMFNGTLPESPYVHTFRAKEITIFSPYLNKIQTDGDPYPIESQIRFSIKGSQKVFVP